MKGQTPGFGDHNRENPSFKGVHAGARGEQHREHRERLSNTEATLQEGASHWMRKRFLSRAVPALAYEEPCCAWNGPCGACDKFYNTLQP